jgi:hypothetical protein
MEIFILEVGTTQLILNIQLNILRNFMLKILNKETFQVLILKGKIVKEMEIMNNFHKD